MILSLVFTSFKTVTVAWVRAVVGSKVAVTFPVVAAAIAFNCAAVGVPAGLIIIFSFPRAVKEALFVIYTLCTSAKSPLTVVASNLIFPPVSPKRLPKLPAAAVVPFTVRVNVSAVVVVAVVNFASKLAAVSASTVAVKSPEPAALIAANSVSVIWPDTVVSVIVAPAAAAVVKAAVKVATSFASPVTVVILLASNWAIFWNLAPKLNKSEAFTVLSVVVKDISSFAFTSERAFKVSATFPSLIVAVNSPFVAFAISFASVAVSSIAEISTATAVLFF